MGHLDRVRVASPVRAKGNGTALERSICLSYSVVSEYVRNPITFGSSNLPLFGVDSQLDIR
jgi:hypothetical protein